MLEDSLGLQAVCIPNPFVKEDAKMKLKQRYTTFKHSDIAAALTGDALETFQKLCGIISNYRIVRGVGELEGLVIEKDWPEYQPTLDLLSKRVEQETNKEHKQVRKFTLDELLAELGIKSDLSTRSELEQVNNLICVTLQLTKAEKDTLKAIYEHGPTDDGGVLSKVDRDSLISLGLVTRIVTREEGSLNACTVKGNHARRIIEYMDKAKLN